MENKGTCWQVWDAGHTNSDIYPERNGLPEIFTSGYNAGKAKDGDLVLARAAQENMIADLEQKDIFVIGAPSPWSGDARHPGTAQGPGAENAALARGGRLDRNAGDHPRRRHQGPRHDRSYRAADRRHGSRPHVDDGGGCLPDTRAAGTEPAGARGRAEGDRRAGRLADFLGAG